MEEIKLDTAEARIALSGETELGAIIEQQPLYLIGKRTRIETKQKGQNAFAQIDVFWEECRADGTLNALRAMVPEAQCYLAACHNFETKAYDYWIAVQVTEDDAAPEGFELLQTEEGPHAVFFCEGPAPQSAFDRWAWVYRDWFAKGHYFHGASPELEVYPFGDMLSPDYKSELRVPVKPVPADYYRRKRMMPIKQMVLPLVGVIAGLLLGTRFGDATVGMLIGLFGGFVANMVWHQMQADKEKREKEAEKEAEKEPKE